MPKDKTHFENSGISSKLKAGPIKFPRPGPTFDIDVAAADTDVKISRPDNERRNEIITKVTKNINKNVITDSTISKVKFSPLYL